MTKIHPTIITTTIDETKMETKSMTKIHPTIITTTIDETKMENGNKESKVKKREGHNTPKGGLHLQI
jgi:hypothetical protein